MFVPNHKMAFTLVETMISSSIAIIVLGAIVSTMIFCQKMFRQTMAEAESSLALREIRDKLLFHAGIKDDGTRLDDGLLTGRWEDDTASLRMRWVDYQDDGSALQYKESVRVIFNSDAKGNYFFNEKGSHTEANDKWFRPGNFRIGDEWSAVVTPPLIKITLLDPLIDSVTNSAYIRLPEELRGFDQ